MTHPEDVTVRWVPRTGPPRRLRFRPTADGEWWCCTEEWTGCHWRETGRERVTDISIVGPDASQTYESLTD